MPIYRYQCKQCYRTHSVRRSMTDAEEVPVCCDAQMMRLYEFYINPNPWAYQEENRMGWISEKEMTQMRKEWDKDLETSYETPLSKPEKPAPDSLAKMFAERGLMSS